MRFLNIGIVQINPKVRDFPGNSERILSTWKELDKPSHLVCFPELALTGYLLKKFYLDWHFRASPLQRCSL